MFRRNAPRETQSAAPEAAVPPAGSGTGGEAAVLLQIYEIVTGDAFDEAYHWVRTEFGVNTWQDVKIRCPRGSRELRYLQRVYLFVETLGDIVRRNLVAETPVFKALGEIGLNAWETIMPWVEDARRELQDPALYGQIEWLAARYFDWQREPR